MFEYASLNFCVMKGKGMNSINFKSLDEVIECYGRENIIAIDNIRQVIFYTSHGCQPKFVYENELKPGKITMWFLKTETAYIYKKWMESNTRVCVK